MKALKITLTLAVFCLTIAGVSNKVENVTTNETIEKVDKDEFKFIASVRKNTSKPTQDS